MTTTATPPSHWPPVSRSEGLHVGPTQITVPTGEAAKLLRLLFEPYGSLKGAGAGALVDAALAFDDGRIADGFELFSLAKADADNANPDDAWMTPCSMTVVLTACGEHAPYGVRVESAAGCCFTVKVVDHDRRMLQAYSNGRHGDQMQFGKAIEITVDTGANHRAPKYDQTRETHGYGRLGWLYGALHNAYWSGAPMSVWVEHQWAMDAVANPPMERRRAAAEGRDWTDPPQEVPEPSAAPPVAVRKPRPQREEG